MSYRVNGKVYLSPSQAIKAAARIFKESGNVVAVEKSERGLFLKDGRIVLAPKKPELVPWFRKSVGRAQ